MEKLNEEVVIEENDSPDYKKYPPPLPVYVMFLSLSVNIFKRFKYLKLKTGKQLDEEQANFLNWNPHIFPASVNKNKIKHLAEKLSYHQNSDRSMFAEFDTIGDEESEGFSVGNLKK